MSNIILRAKFSSSFELEFAEYREILKKAINRYEWARNSGYMHIEAKELAHNVLYRDLPPYSYSAMDIASNEILCNPDPVWFARKNRLVNLSSIKPFMDADVFGETKKMLQNTFVEEGVQHNQSFLNTYIDLHEKNKNEVFDPEIL